MAANDTPKQLIAKESRTESEATPVECETHFLRAKLLTPDEIDKQLRAIRKSGRKLCSLDRPQDHPPRRTEIRIPTIDWSRFGIPDLSKLDAMIARASEMMRQRTGPTATTQNANAKPAKLTDTQNEFLGWYGDGYSRETIQEWANIKYQAYYKRLKRLRDTFPTLLSKAEYARGQAIETTKQSRHTKPVSSQRERVAALRKADKLPH